MKVIILLSLFFSLNAFSNDTIRNFDLNVTLSGLDKSWVDRIYLIEVKNIGKALTTSAFMQYDSLLMSTNGEFSLSKNTVLKSNTLYRLNVIQKKQYPNGAFLNLKASEQNFVFFVPTNDAQFTIQGDINSFSKSAKFMEADAVNRELSKFRDLRKMEMIALDGLLSKIQNYGHIQDSLTVYKAIGFQIMKKARKRYKNFSDSSEFFLPSILATNFYSVKKDSVMFDKLVKRYQNANPKHIYTTQFTDMFNLQYLTLPLGGIAPEITLPDTNNTLISLSSFRGHYVLVDFWASWCKPCRAENVNVVKPLYEKYRDDGLVVLSVSRDESESLWKAAVIDDELPWIQVSDLNPDSEVFVDYFIKKLPTTYLIDKQGKIIAKDLRGKDLIDFLSKLYANE
ncbi:peroxiredoxin family protein [Putridiphycobacter roseus]|uniref:peroxiredoxin family protein n=1 Tax=Putridiphycobacter roseus TaxID=2219161 RepID=UPI0036291D2D